MRDTTPPPTVTPPPHRGAARQMYGSGSLRPPGSSPFTNNHGQIKTRPPMNPNAQNGYNRILMAPLDQPFLYPFPITIQDIKNLNRGSYPIIIRDRDKTGGYPIVLGEDGQPLMIPKSRNGLKIPPYHGYPRDRFPIEYGRLPGKGFSEVELGPRRYPPIRTKSFEREHSLNVKIPENDDDLYLHPCGEECPTGHYMCVSSCTCIQMEFR